MRKTLIVTGLVLVSLYLSAITVPKSYYPREGPTETVNQVPGNLTALSFVATPSPIELSRPWDLEWLPDGRAMITEQRGIVKLVSDPYGDNPIVAQVLKVDAFVRSETGLMGLAIDPDFRTNQLVYLHYTVSEDSSREHADLS